MTNQTKKTPLFYDLVEDALNNYNNPKWLKRNPLLTSPYMLGAYLQDASKAADPIYRGEVLKQLLQDTAAQISSGNHHDYPRMIDLIFFSDEEIPGEICHQFNLERSSFYKVRKKAIQALTDALIQALKPALRLERPNLAEHDIIVGRDGDVDACLRALEKEQTISITGGGGVGKTHLGKHVISKVGSRPVFWFTFSPGLNDRLSTLLFNLGYFFHVNGVPSLWSQLLVDAQSADLNMIFSVIRYTLGRLKENPPILCFDEIDLLQANEIEEHDEIRRFLEGLHGLTAMIFMGQRTYLDADLPLLLGVLLQEQMEALLDVVEVSLSDEGLKQLYQFTKGNPRLIQLFITLHQRNDQLDALLQELSDTPSVEFLLNRIWQRLNEDEKELLLILSVCRQPLPDDALEFSSLQGILDPLVRDKLVQSDGSGALSLLPIYRQVFYRLLPAGERGKLHQKIAATRCEREQYTLMAYHLIQAGEVSKAIWIWHSHQQSEIDQGQGATAQELFRDISPTHLDHKDQQMLVSIQNILDFNRGEYATPTDRMNGMIWTLPSLEVDAIRLRGDIATFQGDYDAARYAYEDGLQQVTDLLGKYPSIFHKELGWNYTHRKQFDRAWQEAQLALYEAINLQGSIQREQDNYVEAVKYLLQALQLAEELDHTEGIAKTCGNLASIRTFQGEFAEAEEYLKRVISLYRHIGRIVSVAGGEHNLALLHTLRGDNEAAIPIAKRALTTFEHLGIPWGIALACQTLAEAYLALDQLQESVKRAWQAIETEEIDRVPDAMRVLGEVELKRGNYGKAETHIKNSIELTLENKDPFLEAYGRRALGQVYLAKEESAQANDSFEQAIVLFEKMELESEIKKTKSLQVQE